MALTARRAGASSGQAAGLLESNIAIAHDSTSFIVCLPVIFVDGGNGCERIRIFANPD
jgi:hypothetical protein